MASCLFPVYVKRPQRDNLIGSPVDLVASSNRYRDVRPYANDFIAVPCGKCINCLKNKQNAMIARVYAEAEKRGTFVFMTSTYVHE